MTVNLRIVDNFLPSGDYHQIKEHLIDKPDIPFNFYEGNVAPVGNTLKSSIINSAVLAGCKKIAPTS